MMKTNFKEIETQKSTTLREFLENLRYSPVAFLVEINGKVFYPDEVIDTRLPAGDRITLIPILAVG
jgi:sulfur carrier protein ThiS